MLEGEAEDNCRGQIMQAWTDWLRIWVVIPKATVKSLKGFKQRNIMLTLEFCKQHSACGLENESK